MLMLHSHGHPHASADSPILALDISTANGLLSEVMLPVLDQSYLSLHPLVLRQVMLAALSWTFLSPCVPGGAAHPHG